ncbi:MAG TPA: hypothetical protein VMI56_00210, partial [Reyranella sp.]|nr:hypothetical protein [Reyranella sp.]
MTSQTRLVVAILAGLVVVGAITLWFATHRGGAWPEEARTAFFENCAKECKSAPGMTEAKYPFCDSTCHCAAEESEKVVSVAQLEEVGIAVKKGTTSPGQIETLNRVK